MKYKNLACFSVSLRNYLAADAIQHVGVNVNNMEISKKFYGEILGGVFIAQITGIKGQEWTSILNADSKTAPQLGIGDALDVCFYSFGNTAVELLRYYDAETGLTHDQNISVKANDQGVAGKHISFNLAFDICAKEFLEKLRHSTKDMPLVSLNKSDLHQLGAEGPLGGWNCFFMSGPNGERIEFNQIPKGRCIADANFTEAAKQFREKAS